MTDGMNLSKERLIELMKQVQQGDDNAILVLRLRAILTLKHIQGGGVFPAYHLPGVDLAGADLAGVHMVLSNLEGANLEGANLERAVLVGSSFRNARLRGAVLQGAVAADADFAYADLTEANLFGIDLTNGSLHGADLTGTVLEQASLWACDLVGVKGLEETQLVHVSRMRGALMPDGRPYTGRYNLPGDFEEIRKDESIDASDPEQVAAWYGVSTLDYVSGQAWAQHRLRRLRGRGR